MLRPFVSLLFLAAIFLRSSNSRSLTQRPAGEVKNLHESATLCSASTYKLAAAAKVNKNDDAFIWFGDAELQVWNHSTCQTVPVDCEGRCTWEGHGYANEILVAWTKTHVCRFHVKDPLRASNGVCEPAPFARPVQLAFTDSLGFVLSMGDSYDGRSGGISYFPLDRRSSSSTLSELRGSEFKQTNIDASINPRMTIHKSQIIVIHNDGFLYFTINLTKMLRTVDHSVMDLGCSDSKRGGGNGYVTSIVSSTRRNVVYLSCASNHRVIEASWNDRGELVKMRLLPNHGGDLQIFPLSNGNEYLTVIKNVRDEPRFRFTVFYLTSERVRKIVKFTSDVWIRSAANPVAIDGNIAWVFIGMDGEVYIAANSQGKLGEVKGVVAATDDVFDSSGDEFLVRSEKGFFLINGKTRDHRLLTGPATLQRLQKVSNQAFNELDPGESEGPSDIVRRASRDTSRVLFSSDPTQPYNATTMTTSPESRMNLSIKSERPVDMCDSNEDPEYKRLFHKTSCHVVICKGGRKYEEFVGIVHGSIGEVLARVDVHPTLTLNVSIDHGFKNDHVKIAIGDAELKGAWKCELMTSETTAESSEMPQPTIAANPAITATSNAVALRSDSAALLALVLCFVALLQWQQWQ